MDAPQPPSRRWLVGLRRSWTSSGALARWVRSRGVTGAVWTPASYEVDDVAEGLVSLVSAGARADEDLLWDFAVTDVRAAADALRPVFDGSNGLVAVWIDPARMTDPGKAVTAARELVGDVRRANVAVGLAWSPGRAAVVERLVAAGISVALSAVRDDKAREAVTASRARGMQKRLQEAESAEEDAPPPPEVPVFLLGGAHDGGEHVLAVEAVSEFGLFPGGGPPARLPLSPEAEQTGLSSSVERLAARAGIPARDDTQMPAPFSAAVMRECAELHTDEVLEDIWAHDHEIWKDDPTEIADRLGWLVSPERMHTELRDLTEFARRARAGGDVTHVVVCGMGGSVFACEMFHRVAGGGIPLTVLDTTNPDDVSAAVSSLDLDRTLFVISSKSGTTVETRSHLEYFWSLVGKGERFVAITDPGTELVSLATERGFLRVFENPADIGGRFSGLSYFGLVPAAIAGVDIRGLVAGARRAMVGNGPSVLAADAPGVRLGAALAEAALRESRDKLTLTLPSQLGSFEVWTEQLIAESLGKEGQGILPVVGEPLGPPEVYGRDRLFCAYSVGDATPPAELEALEADHPIVRIRIPDVQALGAEMYRWEIAVAVVGYLLDINPFDQPDVESAKRRAREALERPAADRPDPGSAKELLEGVAPPRYIALQAFISPTPDNASRLEGCRARLRERYGVACTLGFGPRFLHSTGQLHKGGPNTGIFFQITGDRQGDIEVPGTGYTFGRLFDAQADGDLSALRDGGRPVARLSLPDLEALSAPG